MNENVKTKWLDALRTGQIDGEPIAQAVGVLRAPDDSDGTKRMCCLGVLSEIARREGVGLRCEPVKEYDEDEGKGFDWFVDSEYGSRVQDTQHLPGPVVEWAGLPENNPVVRADEDSVEQLKNRGYNLTSGDNSFSISIVNDYTNAGFEGIANIIEEQF